MNSMRLVRNNGSDRLADLLRRELRPGCQLSVVTDKLSLPAFQELHAGLRGLTRVRLLLPAEGASLGLFGTEADRGQRNLLRQRWLAGELARWLGETVEIRRASSAIPQGAVLVSDRDGTPIQGFLGSLDWSTAGLGLTASDPLALIQATETVAEAETIQAWFDRQWQALSEDPASEGALITELRQAASPQPPAVVYGMILHHLFGGEENRVDEARIVNADTGIHDTVVWRKLYRFQRDGVIAAIDKLNRHGGCILADSVGLGKTFEALAVIKYHELRNDRVLVLCPKRLRENWALYKAHHPRNILAADQFRYDVLNHTDLSRTSGMSGEVDLARLHWGNYDLVVIDESHNFRNKRTPRLGVETRYDRLMRQIIHEGVKTRVLMLSATPVNNRLADLRNQIAFATEGKDDALAEQGIGSIEATTRQAQKQFNRWLELEEGERTTPRLLDMLGMDYFTLLDQLTIARSRKHIESFYGTEETGRFPERRRPINIRAEVDLAGEFPSIAVINGEIRQLHLASHAPLRYVLPHKQQVYDEKYSTKVKGGKGLFRQLDREESLLHLMRVNLLKRMESSVAAFALTLARLLQDVERLLARIEQQTGEVEELASSHLDPEDPAVESLLVGRKVKVSLQDVDLIRWKQDLRDDQRRFASLLRAGEAVSAERDAKLAALKAMIRQKVQEPINPGNRKLIVFTAFADTARYLHGQLAPWALGELQLHTALVTGAGRNQSTRPGLERDLASILTAFAPRAKERPAELAGEGELDLLIASDCLSEGQNLQDCDWLINYDIHWNPLRIIQRFGRIDRIGSPNTTIQLVNFWPNLELEDYIKLEQRVSGRMVLLDLSATGDDNVIEEPAARAMNGCGVSPRPTDAAAGGGHGAGGAGLGIVDHGSHLRGCPRRPGRVTAGPSRPNRAAAPGLVCGGERRGGGVSSRDRVLPAGGGRGP
jgi:hypothetical protein